MDKKRKRVIKLVETIAEDDLDLLEVFLEFLEYRRDLLDLDSDDEPDEDPEIMDESEELPSPLIRKECLSELAGVVCLDNNAVFISERKVCFKATIKNTGNQSRDVCVMINFYDSEDCYLDRTFKLNSDLREGVTWKMIHEYSISNDTRKYEIVLCELDE